MASGSSPKERLIYDEKTRIYDKSTDNHDLLLHPFEKNALGTSPIFGPDGTFLTKVPHDQKPFLLNTIGHGNRLDMLSLRVNSSYKLGVSGCSQSVCDSRSHLLAG